MYNIKEVEKKWQDYWYDNNCFRAEDDPKKKKQYNLVEFPYPSGEGLHMGHVKAYVGMETLSRKQRMQGYNVLFPIGYDAFGLPAENYAIKVGKHPRIIIDQNTSKIRSQFKEMGFSFDFSREFDTTDPAYYKWTQWIFLKMYEHGLAFKDTAYVNFCPKCKVVLANEDSEGGKCDRCESDVIQKEKEVWFLRITDYAEKLLDGLNTVDYTPRVRTSQENWIGKSTGAYVNFKTTVGPISYIMDVDNVKPLEAIGVKLTKRETGNYEAFIPRDKLEEYEKTIGELLKPESWNEYISSDTVFIFKTKDGKIKRYILSSDTEEEIVNLCSEYANEKFLTVESMLSNNDFYAKYTKDLRIYTTRSDTLYGVTFMVIAPEHTIIDEYADFITNMDDIKKYRSSCQKKTEFERTQLVKEKTGVCIEGLRAVNPVNNEEIPVYISDYVMMTYGTGAIMAVPGHDERDFEFANKFNIPIIPVIEEITGTPRENETYKQSIVAVLYDKKKKKYLTLNWGDKGGRLFIGGTRHDNEDIIECAKREIAEETGYVNIEYVRETFPINHHYYAFNKDKAFEIDAHGLLFNLIDDKKEKINLDADEVNNFKLEWVDEKTIEKEVEDQLHSTVFNNLRNPNAYIGDGKMINSGILNGIKTKEEAINKMNEYLTDRGIGEPGIQYKMKDWAFNRQRYWGEPIPIVYCEVCGMVPVPYDELPLELPYIKEFKPGKDGESPLADVKDWVNCKCPKCNKPARRETDTMPQWAGSSWYYLRYLDPHNDKEIASKELMDYWMNIDVYNGGAEHITRHLIYSRFWHRFLYDIGVVNTPEPYKRRTTIGLVLAEDGSKMGKSKGNAVDPSAVVKEHGADVIRCYILFMGDYGDEAPWNEAGIKGISRFLDRIYKLQEIMTNDNEYTKDFEMAINKAIKKVTEDIDNLKYNTAIAELMKLINMYYDKGSITKRDMEVLITLLYPFAPHLSEEINEKLGNKPFDNIEWPICDESKIIDEEYELIVQVNGKVRGKITMSVDSTEEEMREAATKVENVQTFIKDKEIVKTIVVPKKLVNIVIK